MTPDYRVTITHPTYAPTGTVVPIPVGMKEATLTLEYEPKYKSLVETFDGTFIWYGDAYKLITQIKNGEGAKAKPEVLIEITFDGTNYELLFDGLLSISNSEDISKISDPYKISVPIIRNDFWAKIINRSSTPVDLSGSVDLDGGARTPIASFTLPLPSQVVNLKFSGAVDSSSGTAILKIVDYGGPGPGIPAGGFAPLDIFGLVSLDEVETRNSVPNEASSNVSPPFLTTKYGGTYIFNITVYAWGDNQNDQSHGDMDLILNNNHGAGATATRVDTGTNGIDGLTVYSFTNVPLAAQPGERFTLQFHNTHGSSEGVSVPGNIPAFTSTMDITALTVFIDSSTDAFMIGDAFESIVSKLVGADNVQISDYFTAGCIQIAMARGKHFRGYLFSDPSMAFTMSLDEWWACWAPILDIAMEYTKSSGVDKLGIGVVSDFRNASLVSVTLDNIPNIVETYDLTRFYRTVKLGFAKWSVGSYTSIDDPQTNHIYSEDEFAVIGNDFVELSQAVMASLAIEQTRRAGKLPGTTWQLDEDVLGVTLNALNLPQPEVGGDFAAITNLLNASTRYNIRHTPARIFQRRKKWLQNALAEPAGTGYSFRSGEGNFVMTQQFTPAQCEAVSNPDPVLTENQDMPYSGDYNFIPNMYAVAEAPLQWSDYKTIRDNRQKALNISATTINHQKVFIETLKYTIFETKYDAKFVKAN